MISLIKFGTGIFLSLAMCTHSYGFTLGSAARQKKDNLEVVYIKSKERTIAPFAHVVLCQKQPQECKPSNGEEIVELSPAMYDQLYAVNQITNRQIRPKDDEQIDAWELSPIFGDCEDYAITKRHKLIQKGWPASSLRLAVTFTASGEGHMILVVKTNEGDLVLDNMRNAIIDWRRTGLRLEMIQSSDNPKLWNRV